MLIGVVGLIGSGKDTVGDILQKGYHFTKTSFAATLKDAVSILFSWDREMLEGSTPTSREWRERPDLYWSKKFGKNFSPRDALQLMGTEAGRNVFHPDLWVAALERKLDLTKGYVITDVRFPNEMKMIRERGGFIIRVKRGPEPEWYDAACFWNRAAEGLDVSNIPCPPELKGIHRSEWLWCGSPYISSEIVNDGSIEDLHTAVHITLNMFRSVLSY